MKTLAFLSLFAVIVCVVLIGVILAAAYVYDRLNIGAGKTAQQPQRAPTDADWYLYNNYVSAFVKCLESNWSGCALRRPGDPAQHMPLQNHIFFEDGRTFFTVSADRLCDISGGLNSDILYDTTPCYRIMEKLNASFPNFCLKHGLIPAEIVDARDGEHGRIFFVLGWRGGENNA